MVFTGDVTVEVVADGQRPPAVESSRIAKSEAAASSRALPQPSSRARWKRSWTVNHSGFACPSDPTAGAGEMVVRCDDDRFPLDVVSADRAPQNQGLDLDAGIGEHVQVVQ
ncbi:hypothetical protein [Streptomyces sp. NPDC002758]